MSAVAKSKKPAKKSSPADRFEAVAKRLECDPDMAKFDKKLGKLAKASPAKKS